jgi:CspA family cold shock protein
VQLSVDLDGVLADFHLEQKEARQGYIRAYCELTTDHRRGRTMKIGTVRWFNIEKGRGYIHPDDGGPNIFVDRAAVEGAGLSDLKIGQRIVFEIQRNDRTGDMSAVSLKALAPATPAPFDRSFATANPFDIISASILSAMSPILRPGKT